MNVIFNKIFIFDTKTEKAYVMEFKKGINILTSSDIDGTDIGKSVLLRNLYHSLGADAHFDAKWNEKMEIMKETEFIREYRRVKELKNLKTAKEKVEIFWETLLDILKEGEKVTFKGWGSFEVKERKTQIFNNLKTKKAERIPASKKIVFKQGKSLKKDLINRNRRFINEFLYLISFDY